MDFTSDDIQCCTYFVSVDFLSCLWYYRHRLPYSSGSPLLQEGCCCGVYFPSCASTCIGPSSPRLGGRRSARWEAGGPIQTSVQAARSSNTANIQPAQPHPLHHANFAKNPAVHFAKGKERGKHQNLWLLWQFSHPSRVAEVVRRHEGPSPRSLDLDKNFKHLLGISPGIFRKILCFDL